MERIYLLSITGKGCPEFLETVHYLTGISTIKRKKMISILIGCSLLLVILLFITYFNSTQPTWPIQKIQASNLMNKVSKNKVTGMGADNKFITNTADFSIDLFKNTFSQADNTLISPVSAVFPLAMTANGANGNTRSQMNQVLSKDIPLDTLNKYLYSFRRSLKSTSKSKMNISNSIWFRDDLEIEKNFLQTNSDFYDALIYQSPFNNQTLKDINNWAKNNTNGLINKCLDHISSDTRMYLINTLVFDSKWQKKYKKESIHDDPFYNQNGSKSQCKFMSSTEAYYLDDGKATGFIKPYYNDHYRFIALLPNKGISISEYINQMTGEKFIQTLNNAAETSVLAEIPEFHYKYSLSLENALNTMGMKDATSMNADFSKLSKSQGKNIYIGNVIQDTYIYVDPKGTKAGAITIVQMDTKCAESGPKKSVILNRPFIYAIIDSKTNIPIFLGVVSDINKIKE